MKVIKNYLYNAGYQLLTVILPLITTPYVTRVLTSQGYGIYSFTYANIQYFMLIAGLGLGIYGNREIAYRVGKNKQNEISNLFWELEILKILSTAFSLAIFLLLMFVGIKYESVMFIQAINIIAVAFDISWFFMGLENFKIIVFRNTIIKLTSLMLIFIFVRTKNDINIYVLIMSSSVLFGNIITWPELKKILKKPIIKELHFLRHLKPSLVLFFPQIALQLYVQLNKTMLGILDSATSSGFYYSSDTMIRVILSIATATGTVMLPHAAKAFSSGKIDKVKTMLYSSFDFISFLSIPMAFGVAAVSLKMAPWFLGREYNAVGTIMMIESVVIILDAWGNAIGEQYLLPTNRNREYTFSILLGAITNTVINIPFIMLWGVNGAMIAYCASEFMVTFYQFYSVKSELNINFMFSNIFKYILSGLIMFIIVFRLNLLWKFNLITLLLEIIIGIFIYIICIYILKPTILKKVSKLINRKEHKI